ncbi:MAG: TolC family protein [Rhodothermales bacterium]
MPSTQALRRPIAGIITGIALILVALGFAPHTAAAQNPTRITFDEAVRIALEQNVSLQRAANNREFDAIGLSRQRNQFLPDLQFNSNGSQNYGRSFAGEFGVINTTTQNFGASLSSNVVLFDGFGRTASLHQAENSLEASDHDLTRQRQTVVFNVMSSYLTLLERREQIRIQTENLESQRQQLIQIEEFTNVGSRPISDLYQQQASTANAELTLINAERLYQLGEVNLIQVLQLDPFGAYEFVSPEVTDADLILEQYDVPNMLQQAFDLRSDLRAREADIVASREGIRAARSGYWPQLSFGVSTSSGANSGIFDRSGANFFDQFTDTQRASNLRLNLSVPLFNRFTTSNNIQQSKVQYDNARLALEDLQQNIALDVRQSYLDYVSAEKRLDVSEKQLIAAQQALTAEQERYNVGAATLVELSQARASFVQASSDRTQARYDFLFQKKLIDYYMGRLNPTETLFQQP